jgi:heme-degrading monooxygenase HmoA
MKTTPADHRRRLRQHSSYAAGRLHRAIWRGDTVFIAMNRFRVLKDATDEFEAVWRNRDSHLNEMKGFVEFHLLRGPEHEDHILYSSHTVWTSKADFEAWTKSEQFRKAHGRAPSSKPLYAGHPQFEGFEVIQTLARDTPAQAAE